MVSATSYLVLLAGLACVAHGSPVKCVHREVIPSRVYLEPAHHVMKREMDQQIRILPFYDSTVTSSLDADKRAEVMDDVVPRLLSFFSQTLSVRPTGSALLLERDCVGGAFFFPLPGELQVRRCAQQCSATTMCGTVEVPQEHLKRCIECNGNGNTCVDGSPSTDGAGVTGEDYILYVSANQAECPASMDGQSTTVAFAGSCQMEAALDRPVAGFINFCPDALADETDDFIFNLAKHELLHALAFSSSLFAFWRNPDGTPRTSRDSDTNLPTFNVTEGRFQWDATTIETVVLTDWETRNGVVDHTVYRMVTERVVEEAQAHFGCPSLEGMELENQGGSGTMLSHWEKRILGSEAMTGQFTFGPVFSNITFAALEDSGWYRVNYGLAEDLLWGRGAGCEFASGSCREYITSLASGEPITPFCDFAQSTVTRTGCTVDRDAVAFCNLAGGRSIPPEYQFFDDGDDFGGAVVIADYCPFQQVFRFEGRGTECSVPSNTPPSNIAAETYSSTSRCFEQAQMWSRTGGGFPTTPPLWGSGCYEYMCSPVSGLTVLVLGQSYTCQCEGETLLIDLTVSSTGERFQGSLLCPSCAQICHDELASCPVSEPPPCRSMVSNTGPVTIGSTPTPITDTTGSTPTPITDTTGSTPTDVGTTSSSATSADPGSTEGGGSAAPSVASTALTLTVAWLAVGHTLL